MTKLTRSTWIYLALPLLFLNCATGVGFSQSTDQDEKEPILKLGKIDFSVREIQATPSLLKMLEVHVEVFNRSRQVTAPPNSVKLIMVPKEIKYPGGSSPAGAEPARQETMLTVPLPANTGRILIFGFSLPEKIPESITFELQINPPEGEKKTVSWQGR